MDKESATLKNPTAGSATGTSAPCTSGRGDRIKIGNRRSEDAIRLCAYQKWEAAGKPAGDGVQFWLTAERELSRHRSRIRKWWTHLQPWIVPLRLRFFRRKKLQRL